MSSIRRLSYKPGLDGLRAVAVVAVMMFHGGVSWMPGGFLGVDVFFVLSGYLITTLLLRELADSGGIDLKAFWVRRLRRLLPAILLLVAGLAVVSAQALDQTQRADLRGDGMAAIFYFANWRFIWTEQSYFVGLPSPLRHIWSLSVEEQWYLFFPALTAVFLRRRFLLGPFMAVLAVATAASMAWMWHQVGDAGDTSRAYYGTDTRAHTILIGALLAGGAHRWALHVHRRALGLWGALGAVGVMAAYLRVDELDRWMYRGGFLLLAVASAGVVAAIAVPEKPISGFGLLRFSPLVAIGKISYGLYLWHWPVDVILTPSRIRLEGTAEWHEPAVLLIRTAAAFALAVASYSLFESRVRNRGVAALTDPFRRRARSEAHIVQGPVVVAACVGLATAVLAAGTWNTARPQAVPVAAGWMAGDLPEEVTKPRATVDAGGIAPVSTDRPLRVMFTGDSVAFTLVLNAHGVPANLQISAEAGLGCGIATGDPVVPSQPNPRDIPEADRNPSCKPWRAAWQKRVLAENPDVVVFMFGPWEVYDRVLGDEQYAFGTPKVAQMIFDGMARGVDAVLNVAPNTRFVVLGSPCITVKDDGLGSAEIEGPRGELERVRWVNRQFERFAASLGAQGAFYDLSELLCPDGEVVERIDGRVVRPDGSHYLDGYTDPVWRWLGERLPLSTSEPIAQGEALIPPVLRAERGDL